MERPSPSTGPRPYAVLDIDGVVADVRHRLHLIERRPKDWPGFFARAGKDFVLADGIWLAERLASRHDLVWLTGRPQHLRRLTQEWLEHAGLPVPRLLMRRRGDFRPAAVTKLEALRQLALERPVAVLVDDDPAVVRSVRAGGFAVLQADWVAHRSTLAQAQEREGRT